MTSSGLKPTSCHASKKRKKTHIMNNQSINKIEIKGKIGTIRVNEVFSRKVANFSVCTEEFQKNTNGTVICEATWHNIVAWEGEKVSPLVFTAGKNDIVHVFGRIRQQRYTDASGQDRIFHEILASEVTVEDNENR